MNTKTQNITIQKHYKIQNILVLLLNSNNLCIAITANYRKYCSRLVLLIDTYKCSVIINLDVCWDIVSITFGNKHLYV